MIGSKIGHSLDPLLLRVYRFLFRKGRHQPEYADPMRPLLFAARSLSSSRQPVGSLLAGILLVVSGFFDLLDGAVARNTNMVTPFGGFFDSVLDRYSDLMVMFGISIYFLGTGAPLSSMAAFFAAIGMAIIPYARARAEAASIPCRNGLLERPERVILLSIGLLFHICKPVVFILAVLTHVTVLQRVFLVRKRPGKLRAPLPHRLTGGDFESDRPVSRRNDRDLALLGKGRLPQGLIEINVARPKSDGEDRRRVTKSCRKEARKGFFAQGRGGIDIEYRASFVWLPLPEEACRLRWYRSHHIFFEMSLHAPQPAFPYLAFRQLEPVPVHDPLHRSLLICTVPFVRDGRGLSSEPAGSSDSPLCVRVIIDGRKMKIAFFRYLDSVVLWLHFPN